jgi:uncharacterized protein YbjT (DUF2867 family)
MRILLLGANGFIGSAIAAELIARGHAVTAVGRSIAAAERKQPQARWLKADLSRLVDPDRWLPLLDGVEVVVNASGALQDGARDRLDDVQRRSMIALFDAAKAGLRQRIVQISARTDGPGEETAFLMTKLAADTALKRSGLAHAILRPALVVDRNAHGGTALLRAIAAFPFVVPLASPDAIIQTTDLAELCRVVADAAEGRHGDAADLAIASRQTVTLAEVAGQLRAWLGLAAAPVVEPPAAVTRIMAGLADLAGQLGWRSPMRSTALAVLAGGVTVAPGQNALRCRDLDATLSANPAGVQDLWFARLYLLKPVIILVLSAFWIVSGLMTFVSFSEARGMMASAMPGTPATALTAGTALLDIGIGAAVLYRRFSGAALVAMIAVTLAYLAAGSVLQPALWLDPLGPLVKTVPAMLLALVALATLEER